MNNKNDVINGLRVSDFCYFLPFFSDQQLYNFDDIDKLKALRESILNKIDKELEKEIVVEERYFNVSHDTAILNLSNLKMIIETLTQEKSEK